MPSTFEEILHTVHLRQCVLFFLLFPFFFLNQLLEGKKKINPRFWQESLLSPSLRTVLKQIDLSDHMHITHSLKEVEGLVLPQS